MSKRLYRNTDNKMIAGVCSGLAEYFEIDPTLMRLIWVALLLIAGTGILAYLIAWVIMPVKP